MVYDMLQWTPEIVQLILEMTAQMNEALYPLSLLIPLGSAATFVLLMLYARREPGQRSSNYLKILFALIYVYSGGTILLMLGETEIIFAMVGAIAMWGVALLLLIDVYWDKTRFTLNLETFTHIRLGGVILIIMGVLIYPVLEVLTGHVWPAMVLFTAECPTTISLIGLYLTAVPKSNKLLLSVVSLNAVYTGFAVALAGFLTDVLYGMAGLAGLLAIIVYWRDISFLPIRPDQDPPQS